MDDISGDRDDQGLICPICGGALIRQDTALYCPQCDLRYEDRSAGLPAGSEGSTEPTD